LSIVDKSTLLDFIGSFPAKSPVLVGYTGY
jgi:hypothetical protein